jgi:hypothetical protein
MSLTSKQVEIIRALSMLHPQNVTCGKVRIGGPNDGGYVMANDLRGNAICYSIGVGPQVIWDEEMAARGMDVFQYDHTVDAAPARHPRFHFRKIGLGKDDPNLMSLEQMLQENGHAELGQMILKVDIEAAEWDVFDGMSSATLARFDQIIIEFHCLEYLADKGFCNRAERIFQNIARTHVPIHVHGNNFGGTAIVENIPLPNVAEVTFALNSRFEFIESIDVFPTELDEPCNPEAPDLYLGTFKYRGD